MTGDMPNILVVEDEAEWRDGLCANLKAQGYRVIVCKNGNEALTCIREQQPDVAILGLSLDLPAVLVMQNLREVNPDAGVILTVADASLEPLIAPLNEGALSYICKPFNMEVVQAMVRNALKQQRLSLDHRALVDKLQQTNKQLDEEIAERIRAESELARSEELRHLQAAEAARETERKRLAEELHDDTMASLAAMALEMGFLRRQVTGELEEGLVRLTTRLKDTDQRLRQVVSGIFPYVLTDLGLIQAVRSYLEQLSTRPIENPYPLEIELRARGFDDERLPEEVEISVYRVVQQGVTNAVQHAEAKRLLIDLSWHDAELSLSISDDGCGFDVANPKETPRSGHFGLVNLRDRIESLQGTFELESQVSVGTTIRARIPTQTKTMNATEVKTSKYVLDIQHAS